RLAEHPHVALVRLRQPVDVPQRDALAGARRTEHAQDLALSDLQVDAGKHVAAAVALPGVVELDDRLALGSGGRRTVCGGGGRAHQRARKSFVRKKSDTRTQIEARTTVRVVARPTAAAPPSTCNPL